MQAKEACLSFSSLASRAGPAHAASVMIVGTACAIRAQKCVASVWVNLLVQTLLVCRGAAEHHTAISLSDNPGTEEKASGRDDKHSSNCFGFGQGMPVSLAREHLGRKIMLLLACVVRTSVGRAAFSCCWKAAEMDGTRTQSSRVENKGWDGSVEDKPEQTGNGAEWTCTDDSCVGRTLLDIVHGLGDWHDTCGNGLASFKGLADTAVQAFSV